MSCADCVRGSILEGTPSGIVERVNGVDAYFTSGAPESIGPKPFSVIVLTDGFGLDLVNSKLIADRVAKLLACDVWVPDLFDGRPLLKLGSMEDQLLPDHPGPWPLWDKLRLLVRIIWNIRTYHAARPAVVVPRTAEFIKSVRERNKYEKLGAVGYCFGAGIAVQLVPSKVLESLVLCHPSMLTEASIKSIDVPTAWACAEHDIAFSKALRLQAETIFAARKDKANFVPYEFVDYKGTVHGFASRPNLAYDDIKVGFEDSLSQTVEWLRKTLTS